MSRVTQDAGARLEAKLDTTEAQLESVQYTAAQEIAQLVGTLVGPCM